MHFFTSITRDWLTAVSTKDLDLIVQVFETYNSDALAETFSVTAAEFGVKVFDIEYQPRSVADPLDIMHRILKWFAEQYGEDEIDRLIDSCIYSQHIDTFRTWYRREPYFRDEPLLYEEAGYETQEFYLSLGRILNRLANKTPFAVLIKNLDWAPSQVLTSLNKVLDVGIRRQSWGIVGLVEHSGRVGWLQEDSLWQECLRKLERQGLIMLAPTMESTDGYSWYRAKSPRSFDDVYKMLVSAVDMFGFSDVIQMVNQIRRRYNDQHNGQLLFLSAFSSLMLRNIDDAIRDFIKVQNRLQATQNQSVLISSYYWQSICYTLKSQEKYARGAQEQCEKLAMEYHYPRGYVLSQFADFYISTHIAHKSLTQESLDHLSRQLSRAGFENTQSLLQFEISNQIYQFDRASSRKYLKRSVEALRRSRIRRNKLAFSRSLHSIGQIYMRLGNVRQTHRFFDLSLSILERYQNSVDIVPMLNNLGYFLVGQEEWRKAWSIFERAMSLAIKHRNFNEGSIALYNYVWLLAQSGSNQRALNTLNDLLELLRIRKVYSVSFNSLKDLYIFKGWIHFQLRQPIQSRYCLSQIQRQETLTETPFSAILLRVLNARIANYEEKPIKALNELKQAHEALTNTSTLDLYLLTTLQLEVARLYLDLGQTRTAHEIFDQLRSKAHEYDLNTLAQRVSRASLGIANLSDSLVPDISQPYHVLLDLAHKETQLISTQQELFDIHQINLLVEMSAAEPDIKSFLRQTIEVLDRRIPAGEFGVLLENDPESERPINLLLTNGVDDATKTIWRDWLLDKPGVPQSFHYDGSYINAWPMMMETLDLCWLIVSGDDEQHQVWNVTFLQLVAQQLGLILDRRLREAYLEYQNKTDLLTGILNRAGLYERLKKQFSAMKRQPKQSFALCYFDLDHFKYFNDQFGHDLGDRVLKELVKSVTAQLRGNDELGRIGGDEFIILLRDTNRESAEHLMERLRKTIAEPDWWLPLLIDQQQDERNPVPKEEWISASIGIIIMQQWPENGVSRIDLIAQGDMAMYEAKNKGRNCVVIRDFEVTP
jgi:diguanylate cyclase (GGDEF)-like protein